ncbi:hypothetical protein B0O99DRAFT_648032 [Bisporella sp. PMI_857]|nr:hypothetical protein B0O99DRAFT_648032 [Bisporella sp. PMI_857]
MRSKKLDRSNTTENNVTPTSSHAPKPRPGLPTRQNSVQTRYINMLLDLDTIPRLHNIYASFFTWILLAGFVIFPGTFTTISRRLDKEDGSASEFFDHVKHVPLLYIAAFCSGIGGAGMLWLWFRWRANFVWLLNRIFLPGCLNSLAGLISTLVNVYSQQDGKWSVTAWVTAVVTGGCMVITGVLFALYNFWILEKVRRSHGRDMEADRHEGEGKAHEPALEPGSVV